MIFENYFGCLRIFEIYENLWLSLGFEFIEVCYV